MRSDVAIPSGEAATKQDEGAMMHRELGTLRPDVTTRGQNSALSKTNEAVRAIPDGFVARR
jgi:hypothetical protein